MREVSCQVLGVFFSDLASRDIPADRLVEGSKYSLQYLRDRHERIEWSEFAKLMRNGRSFWSAEDLVELGGAFARSPLVRSMAVLGRLLFDARGFYFWMTDRTSGAGTQLFSHIQPRTRDLDAGRIEITLTLPEGYEFCEPFFLVTKGTFAAMPRLLAMKPAHVSMRTTERGAVYEIQLPPGRSVVGWIKNALTFPFTARAAASELKAANEALAVRYAELEDYRDNLEKKVEERTAELKAAHDEFAETVERLEEAQAARDRIFSNINHEIRTPLSLIHLAVASVETEAGDRLGTDSHRQLERIDHNAKRLLELVDGLLLLAAVQEGKLTLRRNWCDLAETLQGIVDTHEPAAAEQGLSLAYEGPASCAAEVDEMAIERIAENLVFNAIKFTAEGGVRVQLEASGDDVTIRVIDTGIGVEEEARERIFQRFEQSAPAVRSGARGSGIGLSIVRELVEAHGGSVWVESGDGVGSVFVVQLPAVHPGVDASAPPPRSTAVPTPAARDGAWEEVVEPAGPIAATILVAEDERDLLEAITDVLRSEYRVVRARDGVEALSLAEKHYPDLLISDVGMPRMDGFELTRRFRALPGNRLAAVLLLTAYGNLRDRLTGFGAGAFEYVLKPFEPSELRARVRSLLAYRALALQLNESEKLASLGTLSAGLAHEFRNPANGVVNAIGPLRESIPADLRTPGSPTAELLDVLEECGIQIAGLARQLLGYVGSGPLSARDERIEILVDRAVHLAGSSLQGCELETTLGYDGSVPCAAPFLTQALSNLIQNAAEAAGPGGSVSVSTRQENDALIVEIGDSGPGVPIEMRERVFEPFFTTKAPGKGTGLGLFTARQIVQNHGGTLLITDASAGSVFRLELPLHRPDPDTQQEQQRP